MKLLYLADIRFPMERANGIQTIETSHALARRGVDVELVVQRRDERSDDACLAFYGLEAHPHLKLRRVPIALGRRIEYLARALWLVKSKPWDVVYTRDLLIADAVLKLSSTPVVYEAHTVASVFASERARMYAGHDAPSAAKLARLDRREGRVVRNVWGVVTITRALLEALEAKHGGIAKSLVAPDGCRFDESQREPNQVSPRIYYVGQLYPWKGVDVLIEAMKAVDGAELVVVGGLRGEPDLARIEALVREWSLEDRVTLRGYIPPPELSKERENASIFVIPNVDSETARLFTSPLKLFESMATGRPIVASDLPSVREVLRDGENALLVPPGDPHALAAAISKLLAEPDLAVRLGSAAREDARAYTWERRAETLETFLRQLSYSHRET